MPNKSNSATDSLTGWVKIVKSISYRSNRNKTYIAEEEIFIEPIWEPEDIEETEKQDPI